MVSDKRKAIVFATPVLRGPRYEGHLLPVESLKELEKYRDLVLKVARALYARAHKEERAPRRMNQAFDLKIVQIDDNCVTPVLGFDAMKDMPQFEEFFPYFRDGRELVERTVDAIRAGGSPPQQFPEEVLEDLEKFGAGFEKTDSFEFRGPDRSKPGAIYSRETQKQIRKLRKAESYIDQGHFEGAVVAFADDGTFSLLLASGRKLKCRRTVEIEPQVIFALKERRWVRVTLNGQTKFLGAGVAEEVQQILGFLIWSRADEAEVMSLDRRFDELAELEDGWLSGEGSALHPKELAWFRQRLGALMAEHGVEKPLFYATPEGNLQAVWRPLPWRIEADFSLSRRSASLLAFNIETDEDDEEEIELTGSESWARLAAFLAKYQRPREKRTIDPSKESR